MTWARPAPPAPPAVVEPVERPPTVRVIDGREQFRCDRFAAVLFRDVCADRYRRAKKLVPSTSGLGPGTGGSKAMGASRYGACRGCPFGPIHVEEARGRPAKRTLRVVPSSAGPSMEATPVAMPTAEEEEVTMARATNGEARTLTQRGETLTIAQWAERVGITENGLRLRLKRGVSVAEALKPGHPERSCEECGAKFRAHGPRQRFCSKCGKKRGHQKTNGRGAKPVKPRTARSAPAVKPNGKRDPKPATPKAAPVPRQAAPPEPANSNGASPDLVAQLEASILERRVQLLHLLEARDHVAAATGLPAAYETERAVLSLRLKASDGP